MNVTKCEDLPKLYICIHTQIPKCTCWSGYEVLHAFPFRNSFLAWFPITHYRFPLSYSPILGSPFIISCKT